MSEMGRRQGPGGEGREHRQGSAPAPCPAPGNFKLGYKHTRPCRHGAAKTKRLGSGTGITLGLCDS